MNLNEVVTRVRYCERCAKNKFPKKGQKYVLYHQSQDSLIIHYADSAPVIGYSPSIIEYLGLADNGEPIIRSHCCMDGCGIKLEKNKKGTWDVIWQNKSIETLPINHFNALQMFTDTGYEIRELCQV